MDDWQTGFKAALLKYVQNCVLYEDIVEVLSWEEEIDEFAGESGCDTCGWGSGDVYQLNIKYKTADGRTYDYQACETFGELVQGLVEN